MAGSAVPAPSATSSIAAEFTLPSDALEPMPRAQALVEALAGHYSGMRCDVVRRERVPDMDIVHMQMTGIHIDDALATHGSLEAWQDAMDKLLVAWFGPNTKFRFTTRTHDSLRDTHEIGSVRASTRIKVELSAVDSAGSKPHDADLAKELLVHWQPVPAQSTDEPMPTLPARTPAPSSWATLAAACSAVFGFLYRTRKLLFASQVLVYLWAVMVVLGARYCHNEGVRHTLTPLACTACSSVPLVPFCTGFKAEACSVAQASVAAQTADPVVAATARDPSQATGGGSWLDAVASFLDPASQQWGEPPVVVHDADTAASPPSKNRPAKGTQPRA